MYIKNTLFRKFRGSLEKIVVDIVDFMRANPTLKIDSFHISEEVLQYSAAVIFTTPKSKLDLATLKFLYDDIKHMVFVSNPVPTRMELELRDTFEIARNAILTRIKEHIERAEMQCD